MNYIKLFEDGTSEAVDVKPSWGMYEKEHALDNREVYIDGNWYSTTGGELVTNGTFDTDISGFLGTTQCIWSSGALRTLGTENSWFYQLMNVEIGETYVLTFNSSVISGNDDRRISVGSTNSSYSAEYVNADRFYTNTYTVKIVAETIYLGLYLFTSSSCVTNFDNISVYKTEPTIDTLQPPHTYLSNKGKLAGIEVANGAPVDIHYDELAPTLVEDTIKAGNLVVEDSFDLGQKWVDVKSERANGVEELNDTGKPIQLSILGFAGVTYEFNLYIDGLEMTFGQSGVRQSYTHIVPNGSTYYLDFTGGTLVYWKELR